MKKNILILSIIAVFITAFTISNQNNLAQVEQIEGIYIFYKATPLNEFETLGTIKVKQDFTGEPHEQIKTALKNLSKNFPTANGLIFLDIDMKQAKAIKLKE